MKQQVAVELSKDIRVPKEAKHKGSVGQLSVRQETLFHLRESWLSNSIHRVTAISPSTCGSDSIYCV